MGWRGPETSRRRRRWTRFPVAGSAHVQGRHQEFTQRNQREPHWEDQVEGIKDCQHVGLDPAFLMTAKAAPRRNCSSNPGATSPKGTGSQTPASKVLSLMHIPCLCNKRATLFQKAAWCRALQPGEAVSSWSIFSGRRSRCR